MVEEYAENWKGKGRFLCISDHGMMGAVPRQITACDKVCDELKDKNALSPIFACFWGDYLVHTLRGCKKIADIRRGDLVLTHQGRFRPVVNTMNRQYEGDLVNVFLSGVGRSSHHFSLTAEHPLLVRDHSGLVSWVKAKDLQGGYRTTERGINAHKMYLAIPRLQDHGRRVIIESTIYMDPVRVGRDGECLYSVSQNRPFIMPPAFELDEDFAFFLGLFAAEGSFSQVDCRLTGGMRLSLHRDENDLIDRVTPIIKKFATDPVRREKNDSDGIDVTFASVPLAVMLSQMVGVGFANKYVPAEIMSSPRIVQKAFLDGVLAGDGKKKVGGEGQTTLKVGSSNLAYGVKLLLAAQGRWAMVYRVGSHYAVSIQDDASYRRYLCDEDYVWKPISKVVIAKTYGEVFNIEVAEDNSYVGDVVAHNCELYINRFHTEATPTPESRAKFISGLNEEEKKGFQVRGAHLLAIAYNSTGYTNLIRLTTWAYLNGFYGKPRVNYEQLLLHKEGLLFTSCCYNSEIGKAFEFTEGSWEAKRDAAAVVVERYMAMFGDKFYLEIMMLDFAKQQPYDRFILWAAQKYGLKIILTNDCHYCLPEDSEFQQLMLMQQTGKTMLDIQKSLNEEGIKDLFELQDKQLSQKSEEQLNDFYLTTEYRNIIDVDIFQQAKMETVKICEMCKGVKLDRRNKLPKLPDAELRLQEHINRGFKERHIVGVQYKRRAAIEYELICRKGFASYFLIQKKMVDEARRYYREDLKLGSGYEAVGPGRGSAVGALTCYLLGITDVDPVEEDLLFDRFLSDSRGGRQIKLRFNGDPILLRKEEAAF